MSNFKPEKIIITLAVIIITLIILLASVFQSKQSYKQANKDLVKNELLLKDSITFHNNKIGELLAEKKTLSLNLETILTLNEKVNKEYTNLNKKDKKNIEAIRTLDLKIKSIYDSLNHTTIITNDSIFHSYAWRDSTKYKVFKAKISFIALCDPYNYNYEVEKDEIYADIILFEEKGKILAKSSNPSLIFTNINSYEIPKKPCKQKKFGLGFSTGLGINFKGQPTYYLGAGINYNLISLF